MNLQRESGRSVMQAESDSKENVGQSSNDVTASLKDMIQGLTPKKNKFKGRKSLAPSAKGILGKRPAELDEEEEDDTPKRLKTSPLKSIRLPGPFRDDTITRLGKAPKFKMSVLQ